MKELIEPGKKLLAAAFNQILLHPETWNQKEWHCGTTHCFGGWCQVLATGNHDGPVGGIETLLRQCGLSIAGVDLITDANTSISEIREILDEVLYKREIKPFDLGEFDD